VYRLRLDHNELILGARQGRTSHGAVDFLWEDRGSDSVEDPTPRFCSGHAVTDELYRSVETLRHPKAQFKTGASRGRWKRRSSTLLLAARSARSLLAKSRCELIYSRKPCRAIRIRGGLWSETSNRLRWGPGTREFAGVSRERRRSAVGPGPKVGWGTRRRER
jgi:hypothetical protein